ncbi:hypothetical protein MOSE0_E05358 [Monosporozyma servazzii]
MEPSSPEQTGTMKTDDISRPLKKECEQQIIPPNEETNHTVSLEEPSTAYDTIKRNSENEDVRHISNFQEHRAKKDGASGSTVSGSTASRRKSKSEGTSDETENQRFYCKFPNCNKSFTRLEHLSRHNLNHWPKRIFECTYVFPDTNMKCKKTFVRKDLLVRHERRHINGNSRLVSKERKKSKNSQQLQNNLASRNVSTSITSSLNASPTPVLNPNRISTTNDTVAQENRFKYPNNDSNQPFTLNQANINNIGDPRNFSQFFDWVFDNNDVKNGTVNNINRNNPMANLTNSQGYSKNLNQGLGLNANVDTSTLGENPSLLPEIYDPITASSQTMSMGMPELPQQQTNDVPQAQNIPITSNINSLSANTFDPNMNILPSSNPGIPVNNVNVNLNYQQMYNQRVPQSQPAPSFSSHLQFPQTDSIPPKIQDLYSLDYLAADPLQNFMQELSSLTSTDINSAECGRHTIFSEPNQMNNVAPSDMDVIPSSSAIQTSTSNSNSSLNTTDSLVDSRLVNLGVSAKIDSVISEARSTTSLDSSLKQNTHKKVMKPNTIIHKSQTSFIDSKKNIIKDNFLTQKSNISQLKRQKYQLEGSSASFSKDQHQKNIHNKRRLLESMKNTPSIFFPDPTTKYQLSKEKCQELYNLIPELRYIPYMTLQASLKSYWKNFHPQYGLLHKPSFNVNQQPPILILSLIMTGANYLGTTYRETISDPICGPLRWIIFSHPDFQPPSHTYIIHSLLLLEKYEKASTNRYLHERAYLHHGTTIQLLRRTPSLGGHPLRDKTKHKEVEEEDDEEPNVLNKVLTKWIEFESLKRVAFFAFYLDVTHAVVFGYMNLFISFRQIQLDLPCPDKIWESYKLSFEVLKESGFGIETDSASTNQTFLSSLKKLMGEVIKTMKKNARSNIGSLNTSVLSHMNDSSDSSYDSSGSLYDGKSSNNTTRTYGGLNMEDLAKSGSKTRGLSNNSIKSLLGKKLMLAGILSVMFQCQEENDDPLIASILARGSNEQNITWREIISFALNYWMFEVQKDCNKLESCSITDEINRSESNESIQYSVNEEDSSFDKDLEVTEWNNNDFDCKLPVYHMAQITLRIFHHDYYVAAGMPWRMSVMIGDKEFQSVQQRLIQFSKDTYSGGVTIIYAFQLLFEMFIRKDPTTNEITVDTSYDINTDTVCTRPNSIALATLLIWTYCFTLYGPEVLIWNNEVNMEGMEVNEDSETTNQINQGIQEKYIPMECYDTYLIRMYNNLYLNKATDVVSYQKEVWQKAAILQRIPGQNNMIGLVKFIRDILDKSYWDLGRELGKLLNNCIQRSMGKKSHVCHDMYDV